MGNTSSSRDRHAEESVDFGALTPQGGIYSSQPDWNQTIVGQLIVQRKLSPFYRPLEEYEEDWTDDQILAARKKVPSPDSNGEEGSHKEWVSGSVAPPLQSATSTLKHAAGGKSSSKSYQSQKELPRNYEAQVYRGAVECPICFLYYPPNTNQTRCCDQAICTECFVHIKRADPTTTHVVSEPACCPYCMQPNFGVVYTPPLWRTGIGGVNNQRPDFLSHSSSGSTNSAEMSISEGKRRRRSISHTSREVVTIDHIRPDWEVKLNQVRAAVARRANRRIIMRQVGDQLIPIGVSRGTVVALPPGMEGASSDDSSGGSGTRRSRRRERHNEYTQFMGMNGQDLEELMVMEAMRLSMIEENERQRRVQGEQQRNGTDPSQQAGPSGHPPLSSSHQPSPSEQMAEHLFNISSSVPPTSSLHFLSSEQSATTPSTPSTRSRSSSVSRSRSESAPPHDASAVEVSNIAFGAPGIRPPTSVPSALSALINARASATAILGDRVSSDNSSERDENAEPSQHHPEPNTSSPERETETVWPAGRHDVDTPRVSRPNSRVSRRSLHNGAGEQAHVRPISVPHVPMPRAAFTLTSQQLLTPWSVSSETTEEYDFLPSTPQSSRRSEVSARVPLVERDSLGNEGDSSDNVAGSLPGRPRAHRSGTVDSLLSEYPMTTS